MPAGPRSETATVWPFAQPDPVDVDLVVPEVERGRDVDRAAVERERPVARVVVALVAVARRRSAPPSAFSAAATSSWPQPLYGSRRAVQRRQPVGGVDVGRRALEQRRRPGRARASGCIAISSAAAAETCGGRVGGPLRRSGTRAARRSSSPGRRSRDAPPSASAAASRRSRPPARRGRCRTVSRFENAGTEPSCGERADPDHVRERGRVAREVPRASSAPGRRSRPRRRPRRPSRTRTRSRPARRRE